MHCCAWLRAGCCTQLPLDAHWLLAPWGQCVVILFVQFHMLASRGRAAERYLTTARGWPAHWVTQPILAAALAVALTIWLMAGSIACRRRALALLLVLQRPVFNAEDGGGGQAGAINAGALLLVALLIQPHAAAPLSAQQRPPAPSPHARPAADWAHGVNHTDLESAVKTLKRSCGRARGQAGRDHNLAVDRLWPPCGADLCRHHVARRESPLRHQAGPGLEAAAPAQDQILPVVDRFERVIGIVTVADFLRQIDRQATPQRPGHADSGAAQARTPGLFAQKPEVVGQIMSADVFTATPQTPVRADSPDLATCLPHVPVVDEQRKVVGMVTGRTCWWRCTKSIALGQASQAASCNHPGVGPGLFTGPSGPYAPKVTPKPQTSGAHCDQQAEELQSKGGLRRVDPHRSIARCVLRLRDDQLPCCSPRG